MWILNIIAFLIVSMYIAYKTEEKMAEVFPITACGLILLLYPLAYLRCLSWIDGISVGIIGYGVFGFLRQKKNKQEELFLKIKELLLQPVTLMVLCSVLVVCLCVCDRIVLWWDDLNFWATDVKSIYYLDGFAGKYGNTAPEFGDYPPGVQLFKWWFLHFQPGEYKEGLMFAGYYTLNMLLLAPLFAGMGKIKNRLGNVMQFFLGAVCLFVLPSVAETFYLEGNCADLPMAIAYGLFLWSVMDEKNHKPGFSYGRQILTLSLVMICKNTGFQWGIYGLIFWLLYHWSMYREERKGLFLRFWGVLALPAVVEGSWLLSCLLKRRVAKLTGAGIKMAVSGNVPVVDYRRDLVKNFIKGFTIEPIHRQNTFGIDLSVLALLIIAVIALFIIGKKNICNSKEMKLLVGYFVVTALISYGITLMAHLTIFVTELQYLEAVVMTASIERYGAPYTIGLLYVLWQLILQRKSDGTSSKYLLVIALVCLCAHWPGAYQALIGYRGELEQKKEERAAMVEESALLFAQKTTGIWQEKGTRVLYMRDGSTNHSVKDTYVNYEVSPLGVVYASITEGMFQAENCRQVIEQSHAAYLYADATEIESSLLFTEMVENFCYEKLYRIETEEGKIKLIPVE